MAKHVNTLGDMTKSARDLMWLVNDAWDAADEWECNWNLLGDPTFFAGYVHEENAIAAWEVILQDAHRAGIEAEASMALLSDRLHKVNMRYVEVLNSLTP